MFADELILLACVSRVEYFLKIADLDVVDEMKYEMFCAKVGYWTGSSPAQACGLPLPDVVLDCRVVGQGINNVLRIALEIY